MLAKQWLRRGLRLQDRIRSLEESLAKAYDLATGTTASNAGDTVAHSSVSRKPEQYSILAERVDAEKRRLSGILAEITGAIAQVENNTLATLLTDEYIAQFLEVMPGRDAVNRVRYYVLEDRRICREQEMLLAVRPEWNE